MAVTRTSSETGRLYSVEGGKTIADDIPFQTPVRVNTVHDTSANTFRVYIQGSLKYTANAPDGNYYDTFGAYQTSSGSGDINVTWSDIHF